MSTTAIGQTDEWGYTCINRRGRVELFRTPKEYYAVYLWVTENDYLTVVRKHPEDAENIFDSVCNILPQSSS